MIKTFEQFITESVEPVLEANDTAILQSIKNYSRLYEEEPMLFDQLVNNTSNDPDFMEKDYMEHIPSNKKKSYLEKWNAFLGKNDFDLNSPRDQVKAVRTFMDENDDIFEEVEESLQMASNRFYEKANEELEKLIKGFPLIARIKAKEDLAQVQKNPASVLGMTGVKKTRTENKYMVLYLDTYSNQTWDRTHEMNEEELETLKDWIKMLKVAKKSGLQTRNPLVYIRK